MWSKGRLRIVFRSGGPRVVLLLMVIGFVSLENASAATHYIAANGADSNNSTSTATPWLHVPGMPNCAGNCAAYTPAAGDSFIFRGGDTWHFGNSSLTPYTGGEWLSGNWSGTAGNPIYYGVDLTWYNSGVCGASWCRPIMNGDNPTSVTGVASCTYPATAPFIYVMGLSTSPLNNFEFTGMCEQRTPGSGVATYISWGGAVDVAPTYNILENLYFHGWTHRTFSCPGTDCDSMTAILGTSNKAYGREIKSSVSCAMVRTPTARRWPACTGTATISTILSSLCRRRRNRQQYAHLHDNLIEISH